MKAICSSLFLSNILAGVSLLSASLAASAKSTDIQSWIVSKDINPIDHEKIAFDIFEDGYGTGKHYEANRDQPDHHFHSEGYRDVYSNVDDFESRLPLKKSFYINFKLYDSQGNFTKINLCDATFSETSDNSAPGNVRPSVEPITTSLKNIGGKNYYCVFANKLDIKNEHHDQKFRPDFIFYNVIHVCQESTTHADPACY